jgi:thymidylate synthase
MWLSHVIEGPTANDCWLNLVNTVLSTGTAVAPRGKSCTELVSIQTRFPMRKPIVLNTHRDLGYKFLFAEAHWILSGDDRVETIAPFSSRIAQFSDDGETFFGAYGPRLSEQSYYLLNKLRQDKDTRQAVVTIWQESPWDSKDIPCTISVQFLIRNNKLYCIDTMRSSDIWLGWPYDAFNFTMLSASVLLYLQEDYPTLELGDLIMNLGSAHLYTENFARAYTCIENPKDFKFRYAHLDPKAEFKDAEELLNHLYYISRGQHDKLKSQWVCCVGRGDHNKVKKGEQNG